MNFLIGAFSGPNGNPSSTRLMTAFVVGAVILMWCYVSFRKCELQPMSAEMVGAIGVAMGAKVWQRGKENGKSGDTEHIVKP